MLDVSDGLLRDGGRIARASGVVLELDPEALAADVAEVAGAVGEEAAWDCVLAGERSTRCWPPSRARSRKGGASSARCVGCESTRPRDPHRGASPAAHRLGPLHEWRRPAS